VHCLRSGRRRPFAECNSALCDANGSIEVAGSCQGIAEIEEGRNEPGILHPNVHFFRVKRARRKGKRFRICRSAIYDQRADQDIRNVRDLQRAVTGIVSDILEVCASHRLGLLISARTNQSLNVGRAWCPLLAGAKTDGKDCQRRGSLQRGEARVSHVVLRFLCHTHLRTSRDRERLCR